MKKYLAELVGTFVLTFLGCGAAVALGCGQDTASIVGTAIAFLLCLFLCIHQSSRFVCYGFLCMVFRSSCIWLRGI